jgi:hypothetical protein
MFIFPLFTLPYLPGQEPDDDLPFKYTYFGIDGFKKSSICVDTFVLL